MRRGGFTLVELVMVILILAIVAGGVTFLVGRLPNFTSVSTSAGTISQAARAIQQFRSTEGEFPSRLDLLLTDHTADSLPNSLGPDVIAGVDVASSELAVVDVTDELARAISAAGIQAVVESPDIDKDKNPTSDEPQTIFDMTSGQVQDRDVLESDGTAGIDHVVVLGESARARLNLSQLAAGNYYVVFGLGNNCEAVGESMLSAPIHSRQEEGAVSDRYSRFMPVFKVEGQMVSLSTVIALENVNGVSVVTGISDYLRTFYDNRTQSN